jgi:vitamin B12 transporter
MRKSIFSFLFFCFLQKIALAQSYQEINVTAERKFQTKKSNVTKVINDIKSSGQLGDVLSNISGVQVSGDGNGQNQTLFIRGSESSHALVIVDGIKINEVMDVNGGFNFAHLNLSNVESIEVIKGPQSVLYGANALSGVILITTKKNQDGGQVKVGFGSYEKKEVGAKKSINNHFVSASYIDSKGQSAAAEKDNLQAEKDGYKRAELLYKYDEKKWGTRLNLQKYFVDLDRQSGAGGDDPNYYMKNLGWDWAGHFNLEFDQIVSEFTSSIHQDKRQAQNVADPQNNSALDQLYFGQKIQAANINTWHINSRNRLLGGIEYENTEGELKDYKSPNSSIPKKTENKRSIFLSHYLNLYSFSQQAGLRFENEKDIAINIGEMLQVTNNHEVFANYGNAYKYPSFYERFSSFGNESLKVNKSQNFEMGWRYQSSVKVEASAFFQKYSNLIEFNNQSFKYSNIGESKIYGQEIDLLAPIFKTESIGINYTHLNAHRTDDGSYLLKRARHKWSTEISTEYFLNWKFSFLTNYTGRTNHFGGVGNSSYLINDLHIYYDLLAWNLSINFNNMFNKQYESIPGFTSPGSNFYVGVTKNL